ncbi:MAG: class I SAM-dependent methyltransferase [Solirubrobacteraceae bacterium]|nr:class I SAM-dependent methyltransferase [Solirubrobacteraceae bacterium]
MPEHVVWHDVECGRYDADVALWRGLAAAAADVPGTLGPILDVGAGTGRITLDLARRGHEVVALDHDADLLAELRARARAEGLEVETIVADAGELALGRRDFALVMAPMQTVQLLRPAGRLGFLRGARAHVAPGGLVAIALVDVLDTFDDEHVLLPLPDQLVVDGALYSSQPVALRDHGATVAIERIRQVVTADGKRSASDDILHLDRVTLHEVEAEGRAAGLTPLPARIVDATEEHVGTSVVMLRG